MTTIHYRQDDSRSFVNSIFWYDKFWLEFFLTDFQFHFVHFQYTQRLRQRNAHISPNTLRYLLLIILYASERPESVFRTFLLVKYVFVSIFFNLYLWHHKYYVSSCRRQVRMAERSKALRSGRSPLCGRGFESHFWQQIIFTRCAKIKPEHCK